MKRITVYLKDGLYDQIAAIAEKDGLSVSTTVRLMILWSPRYTKENDA